MSARKPSPAQTAQALALLRAWVNDPDDVSIYAQAVDFLAELDAKRSYVKGSPRHVKDIQGRSFHTRDRVWHHGQLHTVAAIDTQQSTCLLDNGNVIPAAQVRRWQRKDDAAASAAQQPLAGV